MSINLRTYVRSCVSDIAQLLLAERLLFGADMFWDITDTFRV